MRVNNGLLCKFLWVIHQVKGSIILCSTDVEISDDELLLAYALRFKIEVSYKQAIHSLGVYAYHFWSKNFKNSNSKKPVIISDLPDKVKKSFVQKLNTFRIFIQTGLIAQGLLQYLVCKQPQDIWANFSYWIKTKKLNYFPSEWVSCIALKNALSEYLADNSEMSIFKKFLFKISSFYFKGLDEKIVS